MSFGYASAIERHLLVDHGRPADQPIIHRLLVNGDGLRLAVQFELAAPLAGGQGKSLVAGFCCVVAIDQPGTDEPLAGMPIVISALDIPLGQAWELRTSGLWAEQICEQAFKHWSYGLEAFGLVIDRSDELLRRGLGHRVPIGWELDFVTDEPPVGSGAAVSQRGEVDGILLTADGERPVDGVASRAFWSASAPDTSNMNTLEHGNSSETGAGGNEVVDPIAIVPTQSGPWIVRST